MPLAASSLGHHQVPALRASPITTTLIAQTLQKSLNHYQGASPFHHNLQYLPLLSPPLNQQCPAPNLDQHPAWQCSSPTPSLRGLCPKDFSPALRQMCLHLQFSLLVNNKSFRSHLLLDQILHLPHHWVSPYSTYSPLSPVPLSWKLSTSNSTP